MFDEILKQYAPVRLFFAKGPGSFMSIKMAYIFLKTVSIAFQIPLYATDGFTFNNGKPIKAMRKLYFVKEELSITTRLFEEAQEHAFALPLYLDEASFDENNEPLYMLPAV